MTRPDVDVTTLRPWIGRQETRADVISPAPVRGLSATLDYELSRAGNHEPLPLPWHWLFFLPAAPASAVDVDGHPKRGGFLPPVPLPRRMWAGGNIRVATRLYVGDEVRRVSTISDISHNRGSAGELVFVTVLHRIFRDVELAIEEEQNLVYREASISNALPAGKPAPARAQWSRTIQPDPVLLFRYSALSTLR